MGTAAADGEFYVPENPRYTIVASVVDSLRFTVDKTLRPCEKGHLASISSFVDPEAAIMGWHDFGYLEGPGWAANAAGGAYEIYTFGRFLGRKEWQDKALLILDHVLDCGFIDETTGFVTPYRLTPEGIAAKKPANPFCLNYKHNNDWLCPGSMAKVAYQLLIFADELDDGRRAPRMRAAAARCAEWLCANLPAVENGWFPRRITRQGELYRKSPDGGNDPFWQTSADGLFILQLWTGLTARGAADHRERITAKTEAFMGAGGIFGSINHDTYDAHENVAYAVAFRVLREVGRVLARPDIVQFARARCLAGLEQFKMREDRNGVATKGLLYMEKSWPTSYLWENAEAALAFFECAHDLRAADAAKSAALVRDGLTILRAAAKHHHGPHGFLTEGVDWSNHVSEKHHIDGAFYGDIKYTEPFLNNQHIAEPTLFYLKRLAATRVVEAEGGAKKTEWIDAEGNVLVALPAAR
ncbi:MAG: hypothetical protein KA323_11905 [Planctomycetes bacterium]|nr:hypothetical protein [Planctomycetota bacterium]NMD35007.1 hypothetical protein [Planctomycetota bacterium]